MRRYASLIKDDIHTQASRKGINAIRPLRNNCPWRNMAVKVFHDDRVNGRYYEPLHKDIDDAFITLPDTNDELSRQIDNTDAELSYR